jgi:hypothetical protein
VGLRISDGGLRIGDGGIMGIKIPAKKWWGFFVEVVLFIQLYKSNDHKYIPIP